MPTILLIRHAQASFGASDYDVLSPLGQEQVRVLVAGLERRGIAAGCVVSGTLRRQRDTAAPCAAAQAAELVIDERFNEYDDRDILTHYASVPAGLAQRAGDQSLSSREFQEILNDALRRWIGAGAASPVREPWPQFRDRVAAGLEELAADLSKGETAVVVSSGGAIAALTVNLLAVAPEALVAFNHVSVNTGITKLAVGRAGTTVISINEHAHLDEAGGSLISYR